MKIERPVSLETRSMSPKGALGRHFGLLSAHIKNKEEFEKLKQIAKFKLASWTAGWTPPKPAAAVTTTAEAPPPPIPGYSPPPKFNVGGGTTVISGSAAPRINSDYDNAVTGVRAAASGRASQVNGLAAAADIPLSVIPGKLGLLANFAAPTAALTAGSQYVDNTKRPADVQAAARSASSNRAAASLPIALSNAISTATAPWLVGGFGPGVRTVQRYLQSDPVNDSAGDQLIGKDDKPVTTPSYSGREQMTLTEAELAAQAGGLAYSVPAINRARKGFETAAAAGKVIGRGKKLLQLARSASPGAVIANAGMTAADAGRLMFTESGQREFNNSNAVQQQVSGTQSRGGAALSGLGNMAGGVLSGDGGQFLLGGTRLLDPSGEVHAGDVIQANNVKADERQMAQYDNYRRYFSSQFRQLPSQYVDELASRAAQRDKVWYSESLRTGKPAYVGKPMQSSSGDDYGANVATLSGHLGRNGLAAVMEDPYIGQYMEQELRSRQLDASLGHGINQSAYTRNTRNAP